MGRRPPTPPPAAAARGLEDALTTNELIMARRNASELIMDVTAMNNELIKIEKSFFGEIKAPAGAAKGAPS